MSIHARNLPSNQGTTLRTVTEPIARRERAPTRDDVASIHAEPIASPGNKEQDSVAREDFRANEESTAVESADLPWYRAERWLAVQLLALVPILAAMFAPREFRVPLSIVGGTLVTIGTVMLLMHKPTNARRGAGTDSSSA